MVKNHGSWQEQQSWSRWWAWCWSCGRITKGLDKRNNTSLPPLPSPFGHTVSNIQRCIIGLVYITLQQSTLCNVSIGHSGSLQSLDRDRWWCEATKAPSEYRIAEPATKSMAFKKKSSFTIPAALSLASIIQKGGPHCQSCSNFLSFRAACYQTSFTSLVSDWTLYTV